MLLQRPGGHSRYTEGQFNWLFPLASSSISSLLRCRDELNWDWPFHNVLFNLISASVAEKSWIWIDLSINVLFYLISADVAEKSRIWIDAESRPTLPPSFWAQPSEVAVLFDLNLPGWADSCSLDRLLTLDLLLCTGFNLEHVVLFLCHISTVTLRPRNDWKIEHSKVTLVSNNFLPIPSKISFHMKKKLTSSCQKFTKH